MEKVKINSFQLFCLMFMFEIGSSIVVGVGLQVKQDAWLAILLGMISSIPLFYIYSYLFYQYPDQYLTTYISKIVGKYIGIPLSMIYTAYFIYISARVLRDFGGLLITTTLTETPLLVINSLMILLIAYGIFLGIEVIGRTGELIFFILLFLGGLSFLFTFSSGIINVENLAPFLENGWKPLLTTVYTQTFTFPFGEMVVFTMILPHLNNPRVGRKTGLYAMIASGIVLSATIALEVTIMGATAAASSQFPLLQTISKVNIANFIQRLDIIVVSTLILGVFIKITVFFYAGLLGILDIFQLTRRKQKNYSIALLAIIILIASLKMASNYTEHIAIGLKWVPIYLHLPLQTGIPLVLFILTLIKTALRKNNLGSSEVQS